MNERVGFFDGDVGVRSMTRLIVFLQTLGSLLLVVTICVRALRSPADALTIGALGAVLVPLNGGVWSTLHEKRKADATAAAALPAPTGEPT